MSRQRPTRDYDARTIATVRDLAEFCAQAARLVARGRDAWDGDETLRWAGEAIIHRVGEAVARLDEGYKLAHPAVPWNQIKATRNLIAHQYQRIDYTLIWVGLAEGLPAVRAEIAADASQEPQGA